MSKEQLQTLVTGNVLGWVTGTARGGRDHWDATLEKVWPQFISEMAKNAGYKGAASFYTVETGEVSIVGIWEDMAARLAYEANSSEKVRAIFNALLDAPPTRHKQVITKVHWQ